MKKILDEGNQTHNFISSSGSGTVINYGSGSDFLTSYGSYGSGSTTLIMPQYFLSVYTTVPCTVPLPHHSNLSAIEGYIYIRYRTDLRYNKNKTFFHCYCQCSESVSGYRRIGISLTSASRACRSGSVSVSTSTNVKLNYTVLFSRKFR
jgi:hypothetical protein